ncbi:glutathione S-transferase [Marinobacterium maritimum]|uniref:Glutathione S-transferase n=1 Tax=Marinobacterium maritimum TaxID=500162 RepID=A0ABP3TGR4_9GAMM
MELIGSNTSPFVRRTRLLLAGLPYTYTQLDIYAEGRSTLATQTPIMKIPVLIDNEQPIYDSRVIARYLQQIHGIGEPLSWEEENRMTIIDAVLDSLVMLLLSQRSGLDTSTEVMIYRLQRERIKSSLATLEHEVLEGNFRLWRYPAICLYTLIDWADFRELINLRDYPILKGFRDEHAKREEVIATDPRWG